MIGRTPYPLWKCIPTEALAKLMIYQWQKYGTRLELRNGDVLVDYDLENIDRFMRQKPHSPARVTW